MIEPSEGIEFEIVELAHEEGCIECVVCVVDAEIMAKVTGSTGATYRNSPGDHKAVVRRVARPATTAGEEVGLMN